MLDIRKILSLCFVLIMLIGGVQASALFSGEEEVNISHLIGGDFDVSVKGVEFRQEKGVSILTFEEQGSSIDINGNKFENIKSQSQAKHPSYINLDEEGNILKADFTTTEGGLYTIGESTFYMPPNSRVYYDSESGQSPKILLEENLELDFSELEDFSKLQGDFYYEGKQFKINGNKISGLEGGIGRVSVLNGEIVKVWEGTDANIQGVNHKTFDSDLNLYYEENFNAFEHKGENFFNYGRNKIALGGEGFKSTFDENNPVVNVYPQNELNAEYEKQKRAFFEKYSMPEEKYEEYSFGPLGYPSQEAKRLGISQDELDEDYNRMKKISRLLNEPSVMEISPKGGIIEIENRNVADPHGILGVSEEKSQAPKMSVTGDASDDVWAEIKNDGISLQTGNNGLINPRIPRRGETEEGIPIELNVLDEYGNSLIKDQDGREIKASITSTGSLFFSTLDANVVPNGIPYCTSSSNFITGNVITGRGISVSNSGSTGCKDDYLNFNKQITSKAAIDAARDDYISNLDKAHDFKPEYAQNLENIALYMAGGLPHITETQIEILEQLPDYTNIKLFIESESQKDYLKQQLSDDVYSRITFLTAPKGQEFSVWAQDYTEGDNQVQILPLTYLGGGSRKTPDRPENDFIYQLEEAGIEVRKIPVEFGGGNVYISKDKEGRKILLTGANSYLETVESYNQVGNSISEAEYREIMKNAFNVDDVQIVATRDENGQIERQHSATFHIDQVMLPIDDGVVAMPVIELVPPTETQDEVFQEKKQRLIEFAKKNGLQPDADWDTSTKHNGDWKGFYDLPDEQQEKLQQEEREIREGFYERERAEDYYETATEVRNQIDQYRELMKSKGFEVIDLKSDPRSVGNYQAYTNGIVYQNKNTGQKTVIMPIFPDANGEYKMEGTNLENKKAFEKAGYKVKTVKDKAFKNEGNLHCITILAQAPRNPPSCPLA